MRSILRPIVILAALAGLAAYATIMWRGPQGLKALDAKQQQIHTLEVENANLTRDIDAKKLRIEKLKHDPEAQKLEVEKKLGLLPQHATRYEAPRPQ